MGEVRNPNGRWAKGASGNPGGRPALLADVRDLAREHTGAAIATLAEIMGDTEAPPAARAGAAQALLDRAWGKPAQFVETAGGPLAVTLTPEMAKELTDEELVAIINFASREAGSPG